MTEDRIAGAVARIEQALARIETQAALGGRGAPDAALAARHEALRNRVSDSLAELDSVIAALER